MIENSTEPNEETPPVADPAATRTPLVETELQERLARLANGDASALRRVSIHGANFRKMNLEGADLSESDFSGGHFGRADLRGATLEAVNLEGSDLANANLAGATLGEANLRDAMLEEAEMSHSILRFADARAACLENAILAGADLLGADLRGADLGGANLRGAILEDANLEGANLTGADLDGATLVNARFGGACLNFAKLERSNVRGASFEGAMLKDARMHGLDLTSCNLARAHLGRARLDKTELRRVQLGGALGEELAGHFQDAKLGYLALERNFLDLGDQDAARWAYGKRRRMQKYEARAGARAALSRRDWLDAAKLYASYLGDVLVELLCDYGESVARVFVAIFVVYLFFTILYGVLGSVMEVQGSPPTLVRTRSPIDLAVFSLLAMTTSGTPVGLQASSQYVYFLTGIQALFGISATGLLGFVIGNRIRR